MRNLELHYQDYMRDSQDSQLFGPDDRMKVEDDYNKATQHFDSLLRSMEKGNFELHFYCLHLYCIKLYPPNSLHYSCLQKKCAAILQHIIVIYLLGQRVVRLKGESKQSKLWLPKSVCAHAYTVGLE